MKTKKILVTGGAGNIGTNLCNELRSRGYKVIALDLYNTERDDYLRCDVKNFRQLESVFENLGLSSQIHFLTDENFLHHILNNHLFLYYINLTQLLYIHVSVIHCRD